MVYKHKKKFFQSSSSRSSSRSKEKNKQTKRTLFTKVQSESFTSFSSPKTIRKSVMAQCSSNIPSDLYNKKFTKQFKEANTSKIYSLTTSDGSIDTTNLNKQDKEALIHNKVQRSIHPWCDGCYVSYINVCKKVASDWFLSIDETGHFNVEKLQNKVNDYFKLGTFVKMDMENKIKHLWLCIYARYKQNVNCFRIISNEEKTNNFNDNEKTVDIRLVVEYSHNLFITELCEIYNKLVDRYSKIYDYHENQEIFNCKVCLIHVDDNPVLSYFEGKTQAINYEKTVPLSRDTRRRK